jgi:hypothetical protein
MKIRTCLAGLLSIIGIAQACGQFAFVTGSSGPVAPPPVVSYYCPPTTVTYSAFPSLVPSACPLPPVIYHVPARNVIYFGRPESRIKNYLNRGCAGQRSVVYFGRGESYQRGYQFNASR